MSELPRSVLLVATDDLNWDVLRATLAELPEVRVTGDVQRADEARRAIERPPDLIIAAAALDDSSSVPLLAELKTRSPRSRLLVLGHQAEPDDLQRLSEIGMAGYLVWSDLNATTFHHCLAAVIGGAVTVVSRTAARALFDAWSRGRGVSSSVEVSERERRVLGHLANGCTREQAAAAGSADTVCPRHEGGADHPRYLTTRCYANAIVGVPHAISGATRADGGTRSPSLAVSRHVSALLRSKVRIAR